MTQFLIPDLERDEGFRAIAYPDPKSGGEPWTIGYGHTGRDVHPGLVWTISEAQTALQSDVVMTMRGLSTGIPWYLQLSPFRQDCLVNMAFNLGVSRLLTFNTFLSLVKSGNYFGAGNDLQTTPWYTDVGDRAVRIVRQLETNEHQE